MAERRGPKRSPVERVRERVAREVGDSVARAIPDGYQRLGRVLLLRLPPSLLRHHALIGEAWREALGVETVLVRTGPVGGEFRRPTVERVAGGPTETEVQENSVRYRFDAARIMFAKGNGDERRRISSLVRPGETVVDLFAGIGYFTLPIAVRSRAERVIAVEANPVAFRYLEENVERNHVRSRVTTYLGDNRSAPLPTGIADRVVLGYLPSSLPWLARALELLKPAGGWLHVHELAEVRAPLSAAEAELVQALEQRGALVRSVKALLVKPYGPGRNHLVLDASLGGSGLAPGS
ncbi:MAG: RsmD family RNA methyltransferase [Thermoplasmata archaeon]|nr:RsmD family RNA methyltransferase [Thermoplasmata archaeon]